MEKEKTKLSNLFYAKIVLVYAIISSLYVLVSDYLLEYFTSDFVVISEIQTMKAIAFILFTSLLSYIIIKKNFEKTTVYHEEIIHISKQLKKSKREFTKLFNHSPIPMWIFDVETLKFLDINEMACRHYGFTQKEYLSMTIKDALHPEDFPQIETVLNKSLMNVNPPYSAIMRHRKKNGEIIRVKVKTSQVTFEGRKGMLVSATDITSELETQNKLLEINSRLQVAGDIASLGYWTHDLTKSEIIWSDQMHKIFETNSETVPLTLEKIKERFHQDELKKISTNTFSDFDNSAVIESERQIITNSGKTKWILERIHLVRDNFNVPIRFDGIAFDITNRKLHEKAIWDSNERFKLLTKATTEAIIDWDINNNATFFGEGFKTIFGYNTAKANKNLWKKNIHPEDRKRVLQALTKAMKCTDKEDFNTEYRFLKANKEISLIQHKGIFIRNSEGQVTRIIGAMIDLTETLEKKNKIELQDKVLKDISWTQSHMVRAPLANLLGLIDLLKYNQESGLTDYQLVNHISESAEKLDRIIHDIVKMTNETNSQANQ
ncbi:MAG: hypothetical protein RL705_1086 [Bacteroidota bacterium]|jgi:PAS domain S-box-containing protein